MNLSAFNALKEHQKVKIIWHGTFISTRRQDEHFIILYAHEDYYVEVLFNEYAYKLAGFRTFSDEALLEPYLNQINISDVFKR